mmetsp:Transcript_13001/g.18084  ORF Transcript_13001/g.18084 Transcript_13001/m.18084 type:complete len:226 (+) Transcript_13001:2-679(+)
MEKEEREGVERLSTAPIIPQKGQCPSCKKAMLWPTVVENALIIRKKKKKQRTQLHSTTGIESSSSSYHHHHQQCSLQPLTQLSQPTDNDDNNEDIHCEKRFNLEEWVYNDMSSRSCSSRSSSDGEEKEGEEDNNDVQMKIDAASSSSRVMPVELEKETIGAAPKVVTVVQSDEIDGFAREGKRKKKDTTTKLKLIEHGGERKHEEGGMEDSLASRISKRYNVVLM